MKYRGRQVVVPGIAGCPGSGMVMDSPTQITVSVALAVTTGKGFTVMVTWSVAEQLLISVPVTE